MNVTKKEAHTRLSRKTKVMRMPRRTLAILHIIMQMDDLSSASPMTYIKIQIVYHFIAWVCIHALRRALTVPTPAVAARMAIAVSGI